jgi:hypothetical protein
VATVATGSPSGRWAAITHGVAGMAILLLIPWKSRVVRGVFAAPAAAGGCPCC